MQAKKQLEVAVGLVFQGQRILIAERPADKPHAGCWEFPGGKVEVGESIEAALARELQEEVGLQIMNPEPFKQYWHEYPDYEVTLHTYIVREFKQQPYGKEGQLLRWASINELKNYSFPGANADLVEDLFLSFS